MSLSPRNPKVAVSVVFVAAMFMSIMDVTIVNVTLPTLGREFDIGPSGLSAISVGYLASLAVVIPASGWVGDRFGGKRTLLAAVALFTIASMLCGIATSFAELVAFRILQGVGGGLLTPTGMAMLFRAFPPGERVRASGILTIPTAFAPALGPVLGGLLVTDLSWRWVFFVNLPIGLFALLFGLIYLPEHVEPDAGRFDIRGFLLSGLGFALVMVGISEGPERGWASPLILSSLAVGAVLLVALVFDQLRSRAPLLHLRLFADRLFRSTNAVMFLATAAFLGSLYIVALFFQDGLGLSALNSGLSTFPEALGVMAGSQVTSRILYPAFGPRRVMIGGLLGVGTMAALMSLVDAGTNLWWMRLAMFGLGYSMSHVFVPTQAAAFARISPAETGRASTLFNAQRQLGGAIGVAVLSTALAAVGTSHLVAGRPAPNLTSYHVALLVAAGIALLGALAALTIHDADADRTRSRHDSGSDSHHAQDSHGGDTPSNPSPRTSQVP
ncbi:MDR family MFS transporter [Frankia sp. R82]|uniref:MDR family MFS transporter n=1 Tax=Frankia sp. R82 TaxID=2950553 RepID=UPI0027E243C3|nr:MDR family MFS transporter [Frankia sp. R82]